MDFLNPKEGKKQLCFWEKNGDAEGLVYIKALLSLWYILIYRTLEKTVVFFCGELVKNQLRVAANRFRDDIYKGQSNVSRHVLLVDFWFSPNPVTLFCQLWNGIFSIFYFAYFNKCPLTTGQVQVDLVHWCLACLLGSSFTIRKKNHKRIWSFSNLWLWIYHPIYYIFFIH